MTPESTMQAYQQALSSHDLQQAMAFVADDAIYLFSNQTRHIYRKAIQAAMELNFQMIRNESYQVHGLRWLASSDDLAACIYEFRWTGEIKGQNASGSGRGTNVLRREENGAWKIVHEHLSKGSLGVIE